MPVFVRIVGTALKAWWDDAARDKRPRRRATGLAPPARSATRHVQYAKRPARAVAVDSQTIYRRDAAASLNVNRYPPRPTLLHRVEWSDRFLLKSGYIPDAIPLFSVPSQHTRNTSRVPMPRNSDTLRLEDTPICNWHALAVTKCLPPERRTKIVEPILVRQVDDAEPDSERCPVGAPDCRPTPRSKDAGVVGAHRSRRSLSLPTHRQRDLVEYLKSL